MHHIFLDCDGVLNAQSDVRKDFIPYDGNWAIWHEHFHLEPYNHTLDNLIGILRSAQHKHTTLHLLSARHKGLEEATLDYMRSHKSDLWLWLEKENIHFMDPKDKSSPATFKRNFMAGVKSILTDLDRITFIDDSAENIKAIKSLNGAIHTMHYPKFRGDHG